MNPFYNKWSQIVPDEDYSIAFLQISTWTTNESSKLVSLGRLQKTMNAINISFRASIHVVHPSTVHLDYLYKTLLTQSFVNI
jgi:hypothetical protein